MEWHTRSGIRVELSGKHPNEGGFSGSVFAEHDQNLRLGELAGLNVQTVNKVEQLLRIGEGFFNKESVTLFTVA